MNESSTFVQQTVLHLEVIWKVVLSEVSKLNNLQAGKIGVKIISKTRLRLATFVQKKRWISVSVVVTQQYHTE